MFIEIKELYDSSDCETCGTSYAYGYEVEIDGEPYLTLQPKADCFGGESYEMQTLLEILLTKLGHVVLFTDGCEYDEN